MLIKELYVKNIGCFKGEHFFTFNKGSNLILGENGKGKSTILNCIKYSITGSLDGNLESMLNNDSKEGFVELEFEYKNDIYINKTSLVKNSKIVTTHELKKNGELVASGSDVFETLNKILPKTLTDYSLIISQKGERLTTISDSDRRQILAQLCELDYTRKIKELIDPQIDFLKNEINVKEKEEYALENKSYNFGEEKIIENVWSDNEEKQLKELEEKQKLYEKNRELKDKIYKLNYKCHDLHDDLERKKIDYDVDKLSEENKSQLKKLESDHKVTLFNLEENYLNDNESMNKQISDIQNEIESIERQLSEIKLVKLVKFNEDELNESRKQLTSLNSERNYLIDEIRKLEYNLDIINKGECPYRR